MNYKALFAAMKAEIEIKKLTSVQISDLAHVNGSTFQMWINRGSKPDQEHTVESFLKLIDMLNINLDEFADIETTHGRFELLRWKNKMTVLQLAKNAQCNQTTVCDYESGRCNLNNARQKTIQNFATALNTTPDYLLHGEQKPIRNGLVDFPKVEPVEVKSELVDEVVIENEEPNFTIPPDPEKDSTFEIALYLKNIGNDEVNAVNARELWAKLGVGRDFSNWIKQRIEKYGFLEGTDYAVAKIGERESSGFQPIEYFISLDMAKELSMVENNAKGKQARRYFIECEKKAKGTIPKVDHLSPEVIATLRQARTVQLAMGMTKVQASKYARELIADRFGFDMVRATTGTCNEQLHLRIVK